MTEQDTFRKLTQTMFDELKPLFEKYKRQRRGKEKEATFLYKHGWRYQEYILYERNRR